MGDISELRGLIVSITFLGVIVLLFMWIPPEFYTASDARQVSTPDLFESVDILSFAETFVCALNETGGFPYGSWYRLDNTGLDIGNRDFQFHYKQANATPLELYMGLKWYWFIFPVTERLEWVTQGGVSRGDMLTALEMDMDAQAPENSTVMYRVKSNVWQFQYVASFSYNNTKWQNFTHAWNFHELYFFWAVGFDQVNTSYNAWDLIGMLLFFQFPFVELHINAIIVIPIWVCIGYVVFILILRAIGAIFGGGA